MAKFAFETAVAFATQTAEGTYNSTLDGLTTSITAAQGLVLGSASAGVRESGLTLGFERVREEKAFLAGSFTRDISDFRKTGVASFTFTMPFTGSRVTVAGAPADADAIPITGLDALLEGMGLTGAAWGSGVGHQYVFATPNPISALVHVSGNRWELLDCRVAGEIKHTAGAVPILTATIAVGSIKNRAKAALPTTLTYGEQSSVSAPKCKAVGFEWPAADDRGFQEVSLQITPSIEEIGDSNATDGTILEVSSRAVRLVGTLWADDTTDAGYEYDQLIETASGNLDQLSFQVGTAMADTFPAEAYQIVAPKPENAKLDPVNLGTKAAHTVELDLRHDTANSELEINFL